MSDLGRIISIFDLWVWFVSSRASVSSADFLSRWGRNNEAALVARPTLRVQSNAEIPRAHGQRIMYDL